MSFALGMIGYTQSSSISYNEELSTVLYGLVVNTNALLPHHHSVPHISRIIITVNFHSS